MVTAIRDEKGRRPVQLTENALRVLRARYLKRDEQGELLETPLELYERVAGAIARVESLYSESREVRSEWETRFFNLMADRRFMPNSPTLMNAGREMGMLSACFVLPVRDSVEAIFDAIKWTALIQKAGGGTGFAFDELRPTGDYIESSGGTTSGPISFWRAFSEATNAIQQGAFRRGANMGMMYIHHPDILKFLHAKEDLTQFTNYNISVKIPDAWMEAFRASPNSPHLARNPRTGREYVFPRQLDIKGYDIKSLVPLEKADLGAEGKYYTRQEIWDIIVHNAHRTGEPGVVFIDRINEANPTPHIGRIEATNPCGEQPLLPFEACNLGSINLAAFIVRDEEGRAEVDWEGLRVTVEESTRFLDNVIDANRYPLKQIEEMCKNNRKIGLGVMGFADALYELSVGYNTPEGVEWGRRFMKFIDEVSHDYSEALAGERGSFPNWKGSIWDTRHHRPMRNSTTTTVAPTGTISIIASCSGGIEPLYSLAFIRNVLRGQDEGRQPMIEVNPVFERVAKSEGFWGEAMMEQIATEGTLAHINGIPDSIKKVFVCAHDITPEWHMRMQAAYQEHCDASISKTINFAETATTAEVEEIYRLAYDLRCKGVTVYRNRCREHQPMALKEEKTSTPAKIAEAASPDPAEGKKVHQRPLEPQPLPEVCSGVRIRQMTPFGNMHINVTVDPKSGRDLEVFAQLGKGGDLANSDLEAICRMVSLWLRSGGDLKRVVKQLHGIGSSLQVHTKEGKIMSLGDGLARALEKYLQTKQQFGIQALLLGEFNLDEVGKPLEDRVRQAAATPPPSAKEPPIVVAEAVAASRPRDPSSSGKRGDRLDARTERIKVKNEFYKIHCPECQGILYFSEGCVKCEACGYAQC